MSRRQLSLVLALVVATRPGFADPPSPAPVATPAKRFVSVKVAGDPASVSAVLAILRERIASDLAPSFEVVAAVDRASVVTPGPTNDEQLARIWVDATTENITLYVVDGPWEHVLVRPVVRRPNPEVTWEEIGHIVELALGALRAGEAIGVHRDTLREPIVSSPAPPPPPAAESSPPPTAKEPEWRGQLRGGVFYASTAYGPSLELASGPGAVVEGHVKSGRLAYGGTLTAEYRLPSTVDRGDAQLRFEGASFHALASGGLSFAKQHRVLLGIGGGLDLVHARATGRELGNVTFASGGLEPRPAFRALARYGWDVPAFCLFAGIGLDIPLSSPRYLLSRPSDSVVLFEPWRVRPFLLVGIETN